MSTMNDFISENQGVVGGMNGLFRMNHAWMNEMNGFMNGMNAILSEMNAIISVNHGIMSDMNTFISMNRAWMNEMNPRTSEMNAFIKMNHALMRDVIPFISEVMAFISEMNERIHRWFWGRRYGLLAQRGTALRNVDGSRSRVRGAHPELGTCHPLERDRLPVDRPTIRAIWDGSAVNVNVHLVRIDDRIVERQHAASHGRRGDRLESGSKGRFVG